MWCIRVRCIRVRCIHVRCIRARCIRVRCIRVWCIRARCNGSWVTRLERPKGAMDEWPKGGPKGRRLEVGARSAPKLLVIIIVIGIIIIRILPGPVLDKVHRIKPRHASWIFASLPGNKLEWRIVFEWKWDPFDWIGLQLGWIVNSKWSIPVNCELKMIPTPVDCEFDTSSQALRCASWKTDKLQGWEALGLGAGKIRRSQMPHHGKWHDDRMTWQHNDKMTRWHNGNMTRWHHKHMTWWRMTSYHDSLRKSAIRCQKAAKTLLKLKANLPKLSNWLMLLEVAKGNQGLSKVAKVAKYTKVVNG